jgi:hypothetical protein
VAEDVIKACPEAVEPAAFGEIQAQLAKSQPRLIVVEARDEQLAKPHVGHAGAVGVTVLEADIGHASRNLGGEGSDR